MDARASPSWPRQVACAGCALQPLCDAGGTVPPALPVVDCRHRLERGEVLFEAGAPQDSLFAVRAGFLKLAAPVGGSGEHVVRFLLPGDAAGLEGFGPRRHALTAVALEDCEVCEIPLRRAQAIAAAIPGVAAHLRHLLARELAQAHTRSAGLAHLSAPQRLAAFLVDLASCWSERGYSANTFRLPMDRREIADYLGLTIESVSRILSDFRARGWASVSGRQVVLHDAAALRACPRALQPRG
jgi:CRP/FNR family transcriptional regulator